MASKKAQPNGHAEALLRKRLEVVRGLREQLSNPNSVASQTVTAYSELLDDLFITVALDVHRGFHTGQIDLEDTVTDRDVLPAWIQQPQKQTKSARSVDAFGQVVSNAGNELVTCSNCGRSIAASRFAPHLEGCLMGGGRNGSRKARRKGTKEPD